MQSRVIKDDYHFNNDSQLSINYNKLRSLALNIYWSFYELDVDSTKYKVTK